MEHRHSGCCGCSLEGMKRRSFLAALGGAAGATAVTGCATSARERGAVTPRVRPTVAKKTLVVQPVLAAEIYERREATSWRPWGGIKTEGDVQTEMVRINRELSGLKAKAEFPLEIRPLEWVRGGDKAAALRDGDADLMLIYGASGELEPLLSDKRNNLVFVRHRSGPVYLWYEIVSPRLLRKTVDELGQPGLMPADVVVDDYDDVLWRMRACYALKNTVGSTVVCLGGASGWGEGGQKAPDISATTWKMNLVNYPYEDLAKRIASARNDPARVRKSEDDAKAYVDDPKIKLETDMGYVSRAFLLTEVFEDVMADHGTDVFTINNCMSVIMPMSETTACLSLTLLNDSGKLAFCESDFVVIPSGVLLHHVASTPVFLQDPTYPHHGVITLAHCTAPRRMDGKTLEKAVIQTHFESDYGAAPKVEMRLGQTVTVIDPDFNNQRWIGFRGQVVENPAMDICRAQVDVSIEGDCALLAREMRGFHWMLSYGDHLKETGYALSKLGIGWLNLGTGNALEA